MTATLTAAKPLDLYDALFHQNKPATETIGLRRGRWISFAELVDNPKDPMSVNPIRINDIMQPPALPGYGDAPPKEEWVFWDIEPVGKCFPRDKRVSSMSSINEGLNWILWWIAGAKDIRPDLKHCLYQYGLFCDPTVVGRRNGYGNTEAERESWRFKYRRWLDAQNFLMSHELMGLLDGHLVECYYRYPGYEGDEESVHMHMLEVARTTPKKSVIACISMQSPTAPDSRCTPAQVSSALRVARAADHAVLWGNFHKNIPGQPPDVTERCVWDDNDPLWQLIRNRNQIVVPSSTVTPQEAA